MCVCISCVDCCYHPWCRVWISSVQPYVSVPPPLLSSTKLYPWQMVQLHITWPYYFIMYCRNCIMSLWRSLCTSGIRRLWSPSRTVSTWRRNNCMCDKNLSVPPISVKFHNYFKPVHIFYTAARICFFVYCVRGGKHLLFLCMLLVSLTSMSLPQNTFSLIQNESRKLTISTLRQSHLM